MLLKLTILFKNHCSSEGDLEMRLKKN